MAKAQLYDRIGVGYAAARRPDPRVHAQVIDALGTAATVINVGAGTGNYEPTDRDVVAVEPNQVMASQRTSSAPVVHAFAEALPFANSAFDAAMAMFTIHHWSDREAGLIELGRVSRRQVVLVYAARVSRTFWLYDYFDALTPKPAIPSPSAEWVARHLDVQQVRVMSIPADCTDGFGGCYWNRPERYLDPAVQAGMSILSRLTPEQLAQGSTALAQAIDSGAWDEQHGELRELDEFDLGYRLVIAE